MEGLNRRVLAKTWSQVAICEERITLMKKLLRMEVGVAEIEHIAKLSYSRKLQLQLN